MWVRGQIDGDNLEVVSVLVTFAMVTVAILRDEFQ